MSTFRGSVLIVGGGPAGMVAALALHSRGIPVEIVEIAPTVTAAGVGVNLQNSPLRALNTLGLVEEIARLGHPTPVVNMLNRDGAAIMPPVTVPPLVAGMPPAIGIGRGVLAGIFGDAVVAAGIPLRLGTTVDALDDSGDSVEATFSDGSRGTYSLVIGADGINSRVRTLILGTDAPQPAYSGQSIWRARAPRGDIAEYELYNGPVSKVGLVPISQDYLYVFALEAMASEPGRRTAEDTDRGIRAAMAGFGGSVPDVVARLEPGADLRPLKVALVDDPWFRGRVVLIGDAAHATTPHISYGLGIAVEDGIVLAELADTFGDATHEMLRAFMARRFERCRMVVENSWQLGQWEQHPPEDRSVYPALVGRSLAALSEPI